MLSILNTGVVTLERNTLSFLSRRTKIGHYAKLYFHKCYYNVV